MGTLFICPRCGNKNPIYVGYINTRPYCRFCVTLNGKEVVEEDTYPRSVETQIDYPLSEDQQRISQQVLSSYQAGKNSLIHAVCGAGKTELVFAVIEYAISQGGKVGFAIPRRDVVIELHQRLVAAFPMLKVIAVYGDHHRELSGDITVLTTHQLYRYPAYFDLIILDEIDAFPYKNNPLLMTMFKRSLRGNYVLLSATPDEKTIDDLKKNGRIFQLFSRFHKQKLPVPNIVKTYYLFGLFILTFYLQKFLKSKKPVFIFTPTIDQCEELFAQLKWLFPRGNYVHSKRENRSQIIEDFRTNKYRYLVTTAVLERGVTVTSLQVIIYGADHALYTKDALIQISGRVGRKLKDPSGEVIWISAVITQAMKEGKDAIIHANETLSSVSETD